MSVSTFQLCGVMVSASEDSTPSIIYHCVLRGLERLLLSEQLSRVDGEALVKLSVDRVNMPSPHRAMAALGLMLTCMYTGKKGQKMQMYHSVQVKTTPNLFTFSNLCKLTMCSTNCSTLTSYSVPSLSIFPNNL